MRCKGWDCGLRLLQFFNAFGSADDETLRSLALDERHLSFASVVAYNPPN